MFNNIKKGHEFVAKRSKINLDVADVVIDLVILAIGYYTGYAVAGLVIVLIIEGMKLYILNKYGKELSQK